MVTLKSREEIKILQEGGKILSSIMAVLQRSVKPGVTALDLDRLAYNLILKKGGFPSFLNYQPDFAQKPFPNSLCVSVNEVIVHGVPTNKIVFKIGDVVSLDLGMRYKNLFTDMAQTVGVVRVSPQYQKMMAVCEEALRRAIKVAKAGNTLGDLGYTIESYVKKNGFAVIQDLVGHGVGYQAHEDPLVFNCGYPHKGLRLEAGMVLALEPMITLKSGAIKENPDGSFSTRNGEVAVHFEKTIAILKNKTLIITP
ncbi:MAG: Methionine aminopeptidase 1 [Parcubacteria group bacterium ADurb.Bin305]|nr:type I methionyl aminopeptidase [Candidatus Paceibacterota bacterium]OQA44127.1 MAG: Methionine aminopeptidase 1 [Parcubacteria group bacterium ADurb.Bin305]